MKSLIRQILISSFIVLSACNSRPTESMEGNNQLESDGKKTSGLCIWKEISVKDSPTEKGKYLTSVFLGEKFDVLEGTAVDTVNEKTYHYHKIKLIGGTEGWVRKDFIALNATAGAFLQEAVIYKRPDLMTSTKKNFNTLDFVAITNSAIDGWAEVTGKRIGDSWFTTGWVKTENITKNEKDVMFAVLYGKAMELKDIAERTNDIQALLSNPELQGSAFYSLVSQTIAEEEVAPVDADTTLAD